MMLFAPFFVVFSPVLGQSFVEIEIHLDWFRLFPMFKGQLKSAKQSRKRLLLFCLNDECVGQANYRHP